MREKVQKMKMMNKNKRHSGLKMSGVEIRTAHSRDRQWQAKKTNRKMVNLLQENKRKPNTQILCILGF